MPTARIFPISALLLVAWSASAQPAPPFGLRVQLGGTTTTVADGAAIAFQADAIGKPVDATVFVTHLGVLPSPNSTTYVGTATITSIDLTGAGDFSVSGLPDPSQTFPVNQGFTLRVTYKPSASLKVTGVLKISYSEQLPATPPSAVLPKPTIGSFSFNLSGVAPEFTFAYQPPPTGNT